MPNISVSSAEFLKSYGRISDTAVREPVSITSHGRERLVLISAEEYRRLKQNDRVALHPSQLSEEEVRALEMMELPAEGREFDHEMDQT
ncbi:MAG: type II toxin-antitoxin system prevent-host-death family antitoxin [Brevundimonas sp.]|uniref:type II toxin-antitoxin system prevent-host-death family antitoxin n=1 Tax=Brevundimonas sp. TaxID=1871086 RepID=UPI002715CECD|nr:type II toxin-antitoxin system prevent-host-death family antitoxin [Brevundimonas sp.]MDO9588482.1 type II toxin-antitoxin system prevent-host-death family antitoxin [Brevundimonas sp.]MDP3368415.1 type II toxin-antitoxin system prevent-host-death family antitoxin [Brevundimonas sp.]